VADTGAFPAISCKQPYAFAIEHGFCNGFNKNYGVDYRGPVVLQVGKQWDTSVYYTEGYLDGMRGRWVSWGMGRLFVPVALARGMLVGVADLVDVVPPGNESTPHHLCHCHWWVVSNFRPFRRPRPFRGQRGVFDVPADYVQEVTDLWPTSQ